MMFISFSKGIRFHYRLKYGKVVEEGKRIQ